MPITTLLGLSFGVFPCLLFGFIMLLSLLMCEYIEEYVAKHLCAWKNRRRRGLRSFYRDFRDRRTIPNNREMPPFPTSSRSRNYPTSVGGPVPWSADFHGVSPEDQRFSDSLQAYPTAPPAISQVQYGAQSSYANYSLLAANDPPPSYEECVAPRPRVNSNSENQDFQKSSKSSRKPSKKSPSREND